jgi:hypothetical protein
MKVSDVDEWRGKNAEVSAWVLLYKITNGTLLILIYLSMFCFTIFAVILISSLTQGC